MARILCVEDELEIREDIVETLTEDGHTVLAASDGEEGLRLALSFRPDVILCDSLMPRMTGPEMISALRRQEGDLASTPCILLSAHADKSHRDDGLAAGADLYLTKPVDFRELEAVLTALLGKLGKE